MPTGRVSSRYGASSPRSELEARASAQSQIWGRESAKARQPRKGGKRVESQRRQIAAALFSPDLAKANVFAKRR